MHTTDPGHEPAEPQLNSLQGKTIHVVDDDEAVRSSVSWLLNRATGATVLTYPDGAAFLDIYQPGLQHALILDVRMPGLSGLEVLEALVQRGCTMPILMLSGNSDVPMAVKAMKGGAMDFIEKPYHTPAFLAKIQEVITRHLAQQDAATQTKQTAQRLAGLTGRQQQILHAVVAGKANKVIALELDLSIKTVEAHRGRMMRALGVSTIPALVAMVHAAGWKPRS